MSGRWWRAYSRARHDPKLLKLTDKDFRWWFNLVCIAGDNGGRLPFIRDIAAEFRVSEQTVAVAVERLRLAGLFEIDGEPGPDVVYVPHNWNVLQYVSDSSSNRVKQFRERRRNVSETPSESESEADTERKKDHSVAAKPDAAKRGARLTDDFQLTPELRAFASDLGLDPDVSRDEFVDFWTSVPGSKGLKLDWGKTFKNRCRELAARPKRAKPQTFAQQREDVAATVVDRDGESQWRARLRGWLQSKFWQPNDYGPPPGEPGCRVPPALLAEMRQ